MFSATADMDSPTAVDWFSPIISVKASDGSSYYLLTHGTAVNINGVNTVVQSQDATDRWQSKMEQIKVSESDFILFDSYKRVIATTIAEEKDRLEACQRAAIAAKKATVNVPTDGATLHSFANIEEEAPDCNTSPAPSHPNALIAGVYKKLWQPNWDDVSLDPPALSIQDVVLGGVQYTTVVNTCVSRNNLRIVTVWIEPTDHLENNTDLMMAAVAILALLPTSLLTLIGIVSILLPLRRLGQTMTDLTDNLVAEEAKPADLGHLSSVFDEMTTIGEEFDTLGTTVVAISKYVPRALVRHEMASKLQLDVGGGQQEAEDMTEELTHGSTQLTSTMSPKHRQSADGLEKKRSSRRLLRRKSRAKDDGTNGSNISGGSGMDLQSRRVAVTFLNVVGFHARGTDIVKKYPSIVSAVEGAVGKHKGILDYFHGDRFMLTHNAMVPCGTVAKNAVLTFCEVQAGLRTQGIRLQCGICVGSATVGQMGSETAKRFSIISAVVPQANFLQGKCSSFTSTECLVTNALREDIQSSVYFYLSGHVSLPQSKEPSLVLTVARKRPEGVQDEWMYELEAGDQGNPYIAVVVAADKLVKEKDVPGAREMVAELSKGITDPDKDEAYGAVQDLVMMLEEI
jgi:class 3 adenylate cyclase